MTTQLLQDITVAKAPAPSKESTVFKLLASLYGEDLAIAQLEIERSSHDIGSERFLKNLKRQIEREEICENRVTAPLMDTLIPALGAAISEWLNAKGRGRPHVAKAVLAKVESEKTAFITIKTVLATLARRSSDSVRVQDLAILIGSNIEDEIRFGRIRDEEYKHYKSKIKDNVNKRSGRHFKRAYMLAVEQGMLQQGQLQSVHESWEADFKAHVGIVLLEKLIESTGLVELSRECAGTTDDKNVVNLAEKYVTALGNRAGALAAISPVLQPMVVPPKPWTGVTGGGYWSEGTRPLRLVRTRNKKHLMRYKDVDMSEVYKAVNTIQNTAWRINSEVLKVATEVMEWKNCPVDGIPSVSALELPDRPEDIDTNEEALTKWKRAASAVYRKERARQSRRISIEFAVSQAKSFEGYDAIYFPHTLDWRGRVYAVPSFNPQGTDVVKGLLEFAEAKPIGEHGEYWLMVHGANTAGVDKVSLDQRVQWVKDNESAIIASGTNPLINTWWAEQDSPFCFLAFCIEWAQYYATGKSPMFESRLALAFDGTCSGLQHFSAMLRDEVGGKAVNLTPEAQPQDVYGIVAEKVNSMLADLVAKGAADEYSTVEDKKTGEITERLTLGTKTLAVQWLEYGVTRSVTKRPVMTLAYGSKKFGFSNQVLDDTVTPAIDSGKGAMFTHPMQAARFLAGIIWDAVSATVIAAVRAMEWLQTAATLISSELKAKDGSILKPAMPIHWTTPIGFPVWSEYVVMEQKRIDCIIFGSRRLQAVIEMRPTDKIDAKKQTAGIAPNFVHSMDASHLMMTVVKAHDVYGITDFAMIHDSFGCHAGTAHNLFGCVRETFVETYEEHDVIEEFYREFEMQLHETQLDKMPALPPKGKLNLQGVLKSLYAFS